MKSAIVTRTDESEAHSVTLADTSDVGNIISADKFSECQTNAEVYMGCGDVIFFSIFSLCKIIFTTHVVMIRKHCHYVQFHIINVSM